MERFFRGFYPENYAERFVSFEYYDFKLLWPATFESFINNG